MKKLMILSAAALASSSAFAGLTQEPSLGAEMSGLAALGLVSLIIGAQVINRRKK